VREEVLRFRVLLRAGFFGAALVALFARVAGALRVAPVRVDAEVDDFARDEVAFLAVLRLAVERLAVDLRAPLLRDEDAAEVARLDPSSAVHLPDITRCAASATASAINVPSFVALAITLLAACEAVSAASSPASRIALRALGLALIAAAAAARPAASISLLIAALASLSTVSLREEEPEEPLLADLAIASSPSSTGKRHFSAVTVPEQAGKCANSGAVTCGGDAVGRYVKGHRCVKQRCPSTWSAAGDVAVRQRLELTNTPFRPLC
jgi:hypothetical protein